MEFEKIKKYLQREVDAEAEEQHSKIDQLPFKFFDPFTISGIRIDVLEPGRFVCSFKIPPRLVDASTNTLHGGAISMLIDLVGSTVIAGVGYPGVSIKINFSCVHASLPNMDECLKMRQEEIEVEAKEVHVGKTIGVAQVEIRNKATGKIIAQGHHTKYIRFISKL